MSELETIKLFVNDLDAHDVSRGATVREVIVLVLGSEEGHLYLGDDEVPLEIDIILGDVISGKHGHAHVSRCHSIEVTVEYIGQKHDHLFRPNMTARDVLKWAVGREWNGTVIDPADRPKFSLYLAGQKDPVKDDARLATFVVKQNECASPEKACHAGFELAQRVTPQG